MGAIAGNLRSVALATTVTLLVPEDERDKANGLVGTVNGVAFAITSVFSGLAIGLLGMGGALAIAVVLTVVAPSISLTITIAEEAPEPATIAEGHRHRGGAPGRSDRARTAGATAVHHLQQLPGRRVHGAHGSLWAELMSVETWGMMLGDHEHGVHRRGDPRRPARTGANPVRTLLLANVVLWSITIIFPIRSEILPLALGFFLYMALAPVAEASEQTIIQKVVPFKEQGRVFGFAQSIETAASPITAFLIGPIAQFLVIPSMTDGAGRVIGSWFGTGPERGMALIFIVAGSIGLLVTIFALRSKAYRNLSADMRPRDPAMIANSRACRRPEWLRDQRASTHAGA